MDYSTDDEEHSILEYYSESENGDSEEYTMDDNMSSTLPTVPNEWIDFDIPEVYAFHSFAGTAEGQANVVKGDSLYLMDDTNDYWWLVRVIKTQKVGYIPAEYIEMPIERLARLNKHRNIDVSIVTLSLYWPLNNFKLALPTQEEQTNANKPRENGPVTQTSRSGHQSPTPLPNQAHKVHFASIRHHYRFVPLRDGGDDSEWDVERFEEPEEDLDVELAAGFVPLRDGGDDLEWDVERFEEPEEDLDVEFAAEQMHMQSKEEDNVVQWEEDDEDPNSAFPDALHWQPRSLRELMSKKLKDITDDEGKDKKKKGSMFGGFKLFNFKFVTVRKKEKGSEYTIPNLEDSGISSTPRIKLTDGTTSSTTVAQQRQHAVNLRSIIPEDDRNPILRLPVLYQLATSMPERSIPPQISPHAIASQIRQGDRQQQALYRQYLNRSPSSPPASRKVTSKCNSPSRF
jgi:hypothetical protein